MNNVAELRAAISRARETGNLDERSRLQGEYRALPLELRRELLTAERVDERAGRRIVRSIAVKRAAPTMNPAESANGTLYGHFAVFDTWTEVASMWEGDFMESIRSGAFADTIANDRAQMKVTLNHGRDPSMGNKVLGSIDQLREDATGAYYEVPLFRGLDQLVADGLRAGAYGASFRFYVMAEEFESKPKPSDYNPRGLPERTITQAAVEEFGPVTFPQYPEATAKVRSIGSPVVRPAAAPVAASPRRSREEWIRSLS